MPTTRRDFIKQGVSVASAGLFVKDVSAALDDLECKPPSSSDLPPHPDIHVQFSGLFVYKFRNGICDVNPLKKVKGHEYKVEVMWRDTLGNSYPIKDPFLGEPKNHLVLKVNGAQEGVEKYEPSRPPLDRRRLDNDCNHWGWTLNLREFLPENSKMPEFDLWPGVQITNGVIYTAVKTSRARLRVTKKSESSIKEDELYSIGSSVGINIYFDSQITSATLDWGPGSLEKPVPMPKANGVTYEIKFYYDPKKRVGATQGGTNSHFHKYYDKMKAYKPSTIYDVKYYDLTRDTATPDVPCMGLEAGE